MTAALSPRCEALPFGRRRPIVRAATEEPGQHDHGAVGRHGDASFPHVTPLPANLVGVTVVVVDDDELSLDYFATALRTCGASVLTAADATEALRLVREHRPDVVLSDLAMRGRDGYWLIAAVREAPDESVARVPIVATTAYGPEHPRERTLAAGFVEHLRKPVDPVVLCRTIGRIAGR
jgi:CheY-like chemotaxis protein